MPKHSFDTCSDLLYGYYLDGSAEAKQRTAFITSLGDQLMLNEQYVSSWSTSSNIAQYFAKRKKYGIVISFTVPKRVAADLRVLKFNNELEYILPPGSYKLDKFTLIR